MKIGVISDIHGNLQAFEAVLAALQTENVGRILCAGDVVGYGANPLKCIELVRRHRIICVRGNHDDMVAHDGREKKLRPDVRQTIAWTRDRLPDEAIDWLGKLPMQTQYAGIEILHASHVFRPQWQYVLDKCSLIANFLFQRGAIAFNGHTHVPFVGIHNRGAEPRLARIQDFKLPEKSRYLINVGSVGQPRDRNPEACYATFDTRERHLRLHRVKYDIDTAAQAIRAAALPEFFATRLEVGR